MLEVNLPDGWKMIENGKAIEKVFSFSSFTKAFDFMKSCEPIIDDMVKTIKSAKALTEVTS